AVGDNAEHLAGLPPFPARDDHHGVVLAESPERHASEHLRRERDDLHEPLRAQLARDRPEDARADRLPGVVDQHRRVPVETDVGPVRPSVLLRRAHDHRLHHVALLHLGVRDRLLHGDDDDVAERGVFAPRAAEHLDAEHLPRAAVVGDVQHALGLDHTGTSPPTTGSPAPSWRLRIASTAQRLSCDSGRVSMMRTRSPTRHWLRSSCALYRTRRARYLRYFPCRTRRDTATITVLSIRSDTTTPSRCFRRPCFTTRPSALGARS